MVVGERRALTCGIVSARKSYVYFWRASPAGVGTVFINIYIWGKLLIARLLCLCVCRVCALVVTRRVSQTGSVGQGSASWVDVAAAAGERRLVFPATSHWCFPPQVITPEKEGRQFALTGVGRAAGWAGLLGLGWATIIL